MVAATPVVETAELFRVTSEAGPEDVLVVWELEIADCGDVETDAAVSVVLAVTPVAEAVEVCAPDSELTTDAPEVEAEADVS